jgi:molecular chaperone DnaK (HSP70)
MSKDEIDKLVEEAEQYKQDDERQLERAEARHHLEAYVTRLREVALPSVSHRFTNALHR